MFKTAKLIKINGYIMYGLHLATVNNGPTPLCSSKVLAQISQYKLHLVETLVGSKRHNCPKCKRVLLDNLNLFEDCDPCQRIIRETLNLK